MFVKISMFHFGDVIGPALWIGGAALLLAAGSLFAYFRSLQAAAKVDAPGSGFFKRMGVFGILLIGAGLVAQAFLDRSDILDVRYEFKAPAKSDIGKIYYHPAAESVSIPLKEMIRITSFKILKDPEKIQMNRNGYIETPFMYLGEGRLVLEFTAAGTEEKNQRSRILAGFLTIGREGTKLIGGPVIFELTPEAKKYTFALPASEGRPGAVRIEFLNPGTLTKGLVRVVAISNVLIRRQGAK